MRPGKLLMIIADDDPVDRKIIRKAIESLNADIDEVCNCQECLDLVKNNSYDCAIIDHMMPDCNGLELIELIRQAGIDVPIIVSTGHGDEMLVVKMIKAGAYDYIPKDKITPELLVRSVEGAIKWHKSEQLRKHAEEEYRILYETAPIGLWRTSIKDGSFLKINKYCQDVLGIKYGMNIHACELYKDKERRKQLLSSLHEKGEVKDFEVELIVPPNNENKWVSITAKIYERAGYLEGCLKDITKEKIMEEELNFLKGKFTTMVEDIKSDVHKRIENYVN